MATGRDGCAGATDAHALAGDHRCRTGEEARTLARTMVERRLAADVQIGTSWSFYRWQGQVEKQPEFRVLLKTRPGLYAELEAAIRAIHPYELPAIQALPTAPAEPGRFITDQVRRCAGRPMSTGS